MKFQNGKFSIFDNSSKFGTLVLLRRPHTIDKRKVALQIGKIVVAFSLKQTPIVNLAQPKPLVALNIQKPLRQFNHNRPILSLNNCKFRSSLSSYSLVGTDRLDVNLNGSFLD